MVFHSIGSKKHRKSKTIKKSRSALHNSLHGLQRTRRLALSCGIFLLVEESELQMRESFAKADGDERPNNPVSATSSNPITTPSFSFGATGEVCRVFVETS